MVPSKTPSALASIALAAVILCLVARFGWAESSRYADHSQPGTLSITTDPDGADVYVDGRLAGVTPMQIRVPGSHRVRILKKGYLENSRIMKVTAGRHTRVAVKLTRSSALSDSTSQGSAAGGAGLNKWVWIGAAGGAAAVATVLLTKNSPPAAGAILISPTATGMAGQTNFSLRSSATDPDKDPLTLTWNFGDGGSGTGESVTHTYASAGTFQIQLSISDGKHTVTAPSTSVTVGPSLTGTWTGGSILMPDATGSITVNCGLTLALTQNGSSVTGTMSFAGGCTGGPGALASGSANPLTHPSAVAVSSGTFPFPGAPITQGYVISLAGMTSGAGTTLSGNVTLSNPSVGFVRTTSTSFTKQ